MAKYSPELREKALKLSDEIGIQRAADELGVNVKTLNYWRGVRKRQELKKAEYKAKDAIKVEQIDCEKEIKNNPHVTFESAKEPPHFYKRGEIYYVSKACSTGSEIYSGRPAVIISNDTLNKTQQCVEVVYLTSQVKRLAPEYTTIKATGIVSTVIGCQISSIDKSRIQNYIGECTPEEMSKIEKCLLYSIGLEKYDSELMSDDQIILRLSNIKAERDAYKDMYARLFERYTIEVKRGK